MGGEIGGVGEQRESLRKRLEKGDGLLNKFLSSAADPAEVKASLTDVENRLRHFQKALEDMGPRLDRSKKQAELVQKDYEGRLGDYLNEPENARKLFDVANDTDSERPARARLLAQLVNRLEHHEGLPHILASYEIRPIAGDYCPPVHLQQLRTALVSREESTRGEARSRKVPPKRLRRRQLPGVTQP